MSVYVAPTAADRAAVTPPSGAGRHRAGSRVASALLAVSVLLALVVGLGAAFGYRGEVVLTGSMRPALEPGDMLVAHRIPASRIRVGQIISFKSPTDARTFTHRVRQVYRTPSGQIAVETRGDANNTSERWTIAPTGEVGEIVTSIPKAGYLSHWAAKPANRIAVFGVIGLLLLGFGLRWIWRR